jgi:hypothetical protein
MFSFIHPSFGRPNTAWNCYRSWILSKKLNEDIEWIISLSNNDEAINDYNIEFKNEDVIIVSSESTNMVQASNAGAELAKYDYIILVSDDMFPVKDWDDIIDREFRKYKGQPAVLQFNDGIREDILTLPVMNGLAYDMLGYLYHPKYISMYADNDLTDTCKRLGIYHVTGKQLAEHRHYSVGKSQMDDTYRKENSKVAFEYGKRLYEYRKKLNFPLLDE